MSHTHPKAPGKEGYFEPYGCDGTGFQTLGCSMMALFQVLMQTNWNEAMNSVIAAVGYPAAVFFILYFVTVNLTLLDLLVAVTIEAFLAAKRQMQGMNVDDVQHALVELAPDVDPDGASTVPHHSEREDSEKKLLLVEESGAARAEANALLHDIAGDPTLQTVKHPASPDEEPTVMDRLSRRASFMKALRESASQTGHVVLSASTGFGKAGGGTGWDILRDNVIARADGTESGKDPQATGPGSRDNLPKTHSWTKVVVDATKAAKLKKNKVSWLRGLIRGKKSQSAQLFDTAGPGM